MTDKFQNRYRIPSTRATWHDYNVGSYFITICTKKREHYFGEIANHEMILSEIGKWAVENLEQITNHYPDCEIPVYVAMPNHLHAIVVINGNNRVGGGCNVGDGRDDVHIVSTLSQPPSNPIQNNLRWKNDRVDEKMQSVSHRRGRASVVMGGFKRAITQYAHQNKIEFAWQERFYDHIIRDDAEYRRIEEYIINNPDNWQTDKFYNP
ncbi:MAG TPA: hypothetical protein PLQ09_02880 [Prolixibacteraceae bacterium]|nr:hypothetical protein [Prolixibacteraceae bacterium]